MKLDEHLLVPFREGDVPSGTVWWRAVVKRVTWGHWLRALKRLTGGRTARRCSLMSGLSSILKGIAHTKFTEWSIALTEGALVASLRSDSATDDASCTVETAHCPTLSGSSCCAPCF